MEKEKFKKISLELSCEGNQIMSNLRKNLGKYVSKTDLTFKALSIESGVPYSTLNNLAYADMSDCKLSTVIAIAKVLGITVDELVGAGTLDDACRDNLAKYRNLPRNSQHLVDWYINHHTIMNENKPKDKVFISVMEPECNQNGNLKLKEIYSSIDITNLDSDIRGKVFLGLQIPCCHYMPIYSPCNILLIANDRTPNHGEHTLIMHDGSLYIGKRNTLDKQPSYHSIRDGKFRFYEKDIDQVIGYVAYVKNIVPQIY